MAFYKFHSNLDYIEEKSIIEPFIIYDGAINLPSDDFIISKINENTPLSHYGDDFWDFRPYRGAGDRGNAKLFFTSIKEPYLKDVKWLTFIIIFLVRPRFSSFLSIGTIVTYFKEIKNIYRYCDKERIDIRSVFENSKVMEMYLTSIKYKKNVESFSSVCFSLETTRTEHTGFSLNIKTRELIRKRLLTFKPNQQHPVIPNRIYSELISQLDAFLCSFYDNKNEVIGLLTDIINNDAYARCISSQKKLGLSAKNYYPTFIEAAEQHGLSKYFDSFNIHNLPSLSSFISKVHHGTKTLIIIYSGMRDSEALSLKINSLIKSDDIFKLVGETSKLTKGKKKVSWVSSKNIEKAYEIAESFAKVVAKRVNLATSETPLFISTAYLGLSNKYRFDSINISKVITSSKSQEIYNLLNTDRFKINESDLKEIYSINNPSTIKRNYKLNSQWRFTSHQFRRTLAYYVAQSGLVSLSALKEQLKHISAEMTLYYCQSNDLLDEFSHTQHFALYLQEEKPLIDSICYELNTIKSNDELYGSHGKFITKTRLSYPEDPTLKVSKEELLHRFKKGDIAYIETPLGACTSTEPCEQKLFRVITACLTCSRAIVKKSRLELIINRQKSLVLELAKNMPGSIELRTEKDELNTLLRFYSNTVKKES